MRAQYLSILLLFLTLTATIPAGAQGYIQLIEQLEAEKARQKEIERQSYNDIADSKDLTKYEKFIADYPESEFLDEINKRIAELRNWNATVASGDFYSYQNYLNQTELHWFDQSAREAVLRYKRADEALAWSTIAEVGTLEAYQAYVTDNPSGAYAEDAKQAINKILGNQKWRLISNSDNIDELTEFAAMYPYADSINFVNNRIHELKATGFYANGNLRAAWSELSNIHVSELSKESKVIYENCMEFNEFSKLSSGSPDSSLLLFMSQYPKSSYYDLVSDMLAEARSLRFSRFSNNDDFDAALKFAKTSRVKSLVQNRINECKQLQHQAKLIAKKQKKRHDSIKRANNGGVFSFGWNLSELGVAFNYDGNLMYYNMGFMLKVGNYNDRAQFSLGIEPGMIIYKSDYHYSDDYYSYDYDSTHSEFHMPLAAQLKLNLFKSSENSRFFAFGKYTYNAIRDSSVESEMSWGAGVGFAWKHFDMTLYYKKDFGGEINRYINNRLEYMSLSLTYYWSL